ncbi:MAG: hypothetical protein KJO91_01065, partial [Gammaproteobacteria bacterium]|nr:hypothetical protein [Gammaproteobacteria bacterium]
LTVIRDGMVAKFLFLPEKEDPDTMVRKEGKEAFERRIKDATTLSEFMFTTLIAQCDISTREGKAQLASKANALIKKMHNSLFKDLLIEELSSLVGLSQQHLESRISAESDKKIVQPKTVKPVRGQLVQNNKTRIAIALLIQNPYLASQCKVPESFKTAITKGLPLLYALQQTIESNTEISSAALLERFRDTEYDKALNILSMLQTPETENTDNISAVYTNIIERLQNDDRYEFFKLKIQNNEPLSADEQKEYIELCSK